MSSMISELFHTLPTGLLAGVSLKPDFFETIVQEKPKVDFFEVHSENYMGKGGPSISWLEEIRKDYPLTIHGVSLSLGTDQPLDKQHLKNLKSLMDRVDPMIVSEHLSWSVIDNIYLNDLLPFPYTKETLEIFARNVEETQTFLGRKILVENPSSYVSFKHNDFSEVEFLKELTKKTGCGVLLDVNNVFVSSHNHGFDPFIYIGEFPVGIAGQIHLAGHNRKNEIYVDTHEGQVSSEVWDLYAYAMSRLGPMPTLIEWDTNVPPLKVLIEEAKKAKELLKNIEGSRYGTTG